MEQVPSTELIKNWVGAFLVDAENIKGVYRNLDVDSLVFTYHTSAQTEEDFCSALALSLEKSKWQRTSNSIDFIEFRRFFKKGEISPERPDMEMFASYEMIRLNYNKSNKMVVVAYVQADTSDDVTLFEHTGEGKWAERVIWPKFNELRK